MKMDSIKRYLKPYKMKQRASTISHAFASALAPHDDFDEREVIKALRQLGQDPGNLKCVYCSRKAATWDHLMSIVKNSEFRGYGHQIGNLVPACRPCNEAKGGKNFRDYLLKGKNPQRKVLVRKLESHLKKFSKQHDIQGFKKKNAVLWRQYERLRKQVLDKMKEGDLIAEKLRGRLG
jgi:5-methylcytosine-specific restriction endonuclease McrA